MKLHQHFEFGQDPFSFCQIQLALNTVYPSFLLSYDTLCIGTPFTPASEYRRTCTCYTEIRKSKRTGRGRCNCRCTPPPLSFRSPPSLSRIIILALSIQPHCFMPLHIYLWQAAVREREREKRKTEGGWKGGGKEKARKWALCVLIIHSHWLSGASFICF